MRLAAGRESVYLWHDTRLNVFVYVQPEAEERSRSAGTGRRRAGLSVGTGVLSTQKRLVISDILWKWYTFILTGKINAVNST